MDTLMNIWYGIAGMLPFTWIKPLFMKNAFLAIILVSPMTALIGVHLTAFRMAFFADAISHSAFTGIALGFIFMVDPVIATAIFAVLVAFMIIRIERTSPLAPDSVISVIMSAGIAVGLAVASYRKTFMRDLTKYLFGDILTVSGTDILMLAVACAVCVAFITATFNRLTLLSLNEHIAVKRYPNVAISKLVFSLLTAVVVALCIKVIGMLLITSLLIIPVTAARLIARNIVSTVWFGMMASMTASIAGLIVSYYLDIATGPAIIIILSMIFAIAYAAALIMRTQRRTV
ncbi:MAG: metal ABC transporter permease [Spirochaetota bacterium]